MGAHLKVVILQKSVGMTQDLRQLWPDDVFRTPSH